MNWLNTYNLKIPDGRTFRVFIAENGGFHANCLWYEGGRMLKAPTESGSSTIHLKQVSDTTAEKALEKIHIWAIENFGGDAEIIED